MGVTIVVRIAMNEKKIWFSGQIQALLNFLGQGSSKVRRNTVCLCGAMLNQ